MFILGVRTSLLRYSHYSQAYFFPSISDELLEDLQSTVARPKLNGTAGGKSSSYREVIKTSSSQKNGLPAETSKHYEFESSGAPERPRSPFDKVS